MGVKYIIGADEAGRGPLAGPVSVGVFATPASFKKNLLDGIRDSKLHTPLQRDAWFQKLKDLPAVQHSVACSSAAYIDAHGIVPAIMLALGRALEKLKLNPTECEVLLDGGLHAPEKYIYQKTIIHGDQIEPLISAASILAKVTRDRQMLRLARTYPLYALDKHKGYGTQLHRDLISKHGLSPIHRKSFCRRLKGAVHK